MGEYGKIHEQMTPEQLRENGRKGGLKKAENVRKRKELKETLDVLLNMALDGRRKTVDIEKIQSFAQLNGKNVTVDQAMMIKVVQRALKGDLTAITMIRDTIGEKPTDKVDLDAKVTKNPLEDLTTEELRALIEKNVTN